MTHDEFLDTQSQILSAYFEFQELHAKDMKLAEEQRSKALIAAKEDFKAVQTKLTNQFKIDEKAHKKQTNDEQQALLNKRASNIQTFDAQVESAMLNIK